MFPFQQGANTGLSGGFPPAPSPFPGPSGGMFPPTGMMGTPTPQGGAGGGGIGRLLSGLFSRGGSATNSTGGMMGPGAFMPNNMSGLSTLGNAANALSSASSGTGGILGTIQNIQKVVQVGQQIMPMVQQFGPLVKNVPAMINMVKTIVAATDDKEAEENVEEDDVASLSKGETANTTKKETSTPSKSKSRTTQQKSTNKKEHTPKSASQRRRKTVKGSVIREPQTVYEFNESDDFKSSTPTLYI